MTGRAHQRSWPKTRFGPPQAAGQFDNLPGFGKPHPIFDEEYDPHWWIRRKLAHEGLTGRGASLRFARRPNGRPSRRDTRWAWPRFCPEGWGRRQILTRPPRAIVRQALRGSPQHRLCKTLRPVRNRRPPSLQRLALPISRVGTQPNGENHDAQRMKRGGQRNHGLQRTFDLSESAQYGQAKRQEHHDSATFDGKGRYQPPCRERRDQPERRALGPRPQQQLPRGPDAQHERR